MDKETAGALQAVHEFAVTIAELTSKQNEFSSKIQGEVSRIGRQAIALMGHVNGLVGRVSSTEMVLRALIRSHPDRDALARAWAEECAISLSASGDVASKNTPEDEPAFAEMSDRVRASLELWTSHIRGLSRPSG